MERNHTLSPAEAPTPRGAHLTRAPSAGIAGRWTGSSPARSGRVSHEHAIERGPQVIAGVLAAACAQYLALRDRRGRFALYMAAVVAKRYNWTGPR
ncbi:hypothetical protein QHI69_38115 (plasmid) [Burkholderia gladioli pv. gladioli]|uniref:hypothetical protein n=1 Tax=Burkholderia gladioli TaxID=28095 RepID=UPI0012D34D1F|nr:hypothetical protein [Burkholderia gladioli]MDJ1167735.1 hypothetical protein [Burkholderia gladioli pv. gladioli]QPQ88961.1 hypothetical protein I6H08_36810 [Burkholderia gladioli]